MIAPIHYSFVMGFGFMVFLTLGVLTWWVHTQYRRVPLTAGVFVLSYAWAAVGFVLARDGVFLDAGAYPHNAWRMGFPMLLTLGIGGYLLGPLPLRVAWLLHSFKLPLGVLLYLSQPYGTLYLMGAWGLVILGATAPLVYFYQGRVPLVHRAWAWVSAFNLFHMMLLCLQPRFHTGTETLLFSAPVAWVPTFFVPLWFGLQVGLFLEFEWVRKRQKLL